MKKLMVIGLVVGLLSTPAFAVQKGSSITTNPFSLMFGMFGVEGNFAVSDSASMPASIGYFSATEEGLDSETTASVTQLGTGLRYYWQGRAINGWYLGATFNYIRASVEYEQDSTWYQSAGSGSASAGALGYGFLIGYQSIWESGMTLDTGLGMAKYTIPSVEVDLGGSSTEETTEISLTLPTLKLAIGYAF